MKLNDVHILICSFKLVTPLIMILGGSNTKMFLLIL